MGGNVFTRGGVDGLTKHIYTTQRPSKCLRSMETPNTDFQTTSLKRQLQNVDFVLKSLEDRVSQSLAENHIDYSNVPTVLFWFEKYMTGFLVIAQKIQNSSMESAGLDAVKDAYCDYNCSYKLIEKCIGSWSKPSDKPQEIHKIRECEKILSEHIWRFKELKNFIKEAAKSSFQSNITSRFNMLMNGNPKVEKSKVIETFETYNNTQNNLTQSMSCIPDLNTNSALNSMNSTLAAASTGSVNQIQYSPILATRPRSISPSPMNDMDKRLLDIYSSQHFVDVEKLLNIYNKFNDSVLLIDFRPSISFKQDHISLFANIINVDPVSIKPSFIVDDILDHSLLLSSAREREYFQNISKYDLVILVDQSSIHAKLSIGLVRLLAILDEKNNSPQFKLKRKPVILDGGFDEWSYFMNNKEKNDRDSSIDKKLYPTMQFDGSPLRTQTNYVHTTPSISLSHSPTDLFASDLSLDSNLSSNLNSLYTTSNYSTNTRVQNIGRNILRPDVQTHSRTPRTRSPSPMSRGTSTSLPFPSNSATSLGFSGTGTVSMSSMEPTKTRGLNVRSASKNTPSPQIISGLVNLGNSCYMNASLQCLIETKELTKYLLQDMYHQFIAKDSKLGSHGRLTNEYHSLAKLMLTNTSKGVSTNPKTFKRAIGDVNTQFRNNDQQDSAEFLHFFLDTIHEDLNWSSSRGFLPEISQEDELNREFLPIRLASTIEWERYLKTDYSSITEIFAGQYASRLECQNCHKTSTTYIPFNMLSVPIPRNNGNLNLYDCIDKFTSAEILSGSNAWNCPSCHMSRQTKKQLTICRLPNILVIHLERFSMGSNYEYVKNKSKIDIPTKLEMKRYWPTIHDEREREQLKKLPSRGQEGEWEYQLYGVVRHYGTLNSGHYISEVRKNGQWLKFDDETVGRGSVGSKPESDGSAYILFYEKVN